MSRIMLIGSLRAPIDKENQLSVEQLIGASHNAADEIETLDKKVEMLTNALKNIASSESEEWCKKCGWIGLGSECTVDKISYEYPLDCGSSCPKCSNETLEYYADEYAQYILKKLEE